MKVAILSTIFRYQKSVPVFDEKITEKNDAVSFRFKTGAGRENFYSNAGRFL